MQLKIIQDDKKHQGAVPCIGWSTSSGELYTLGEDQKFYKWSREGDSLGILSTSLFNNSSLHSMEVEAPQTHVKSNVSGSEKSSNTSSSASPSSSSSMGVIPYYAACMEWFPGKSELLAIGMTDGNIVLFGKLGRTEKIIDAHRSTVLCLSWNSDGSALLSGGEDGLIKLWSKAGMLRSVLITQSIPIYAAEWSSDSNQVLFTTGNSLTLKSLQPGGKTLSWKAHDGCILKLSWSRITSFIVSGGEDKKYKVWDHFGRLLYSSQMMDHVVSSLVWAPMGDCFAVGSFNSLRICDRLGWTQAITPTSCGSIYSMSWTPDGTTLACGSARGSVLFCHVIERRIVWRHLEVTLMEEKLIYVKDFITGVDEKYDFKENIMNLSVGHHTMVFVSATQCHVLSSNKSMNSFDLPNSLGRISIIKQCKTGFALVDLTLGISLYSYSGKLLCTIKCPRPELISESCVALSEDTLVLQDGIHESTVNVYDTQTGKLIHSLTHRHGIKALTLDHVGLQRHLAMVDKNMDAWMVPIGKSSPFLKLGGMTESICFAEDSPMLGSIMDGVMCFWMYPAVVFLDPEIKALTKKTKDPLKQGHIVWWVGSECYVRKGDGSHIVVGWTCPYTKLIHDYASRKKWDPCLKLCRSAKSKELWAVLACLALNGNDLNTAEVAYAAIGEAHKVQSICNIRELKSKELRNAEFLVFKKQFKEAEAMLLTSGQIYFAIRMWIELYQWDRALELALRYKDYLPIVVSSRCDYVTKMGIPELNKKYLSYTQTLVLDKDAIKAQVLAEEKKVGLVK